MAVFTYRTLLGLFLAGLLAACSSHDAAFSFHLTASLTLDGFVLRVEFAEERYVFFFLPAFFPHY